MFISHKLNYIKIFFYFLGWPKVAIIALPKQKILITVLTLLFCYFIPMIISCAIYISLICNKKKKFKNKVSIERNPIERGDRVELKNATVMGQVETREKTMSSLSTTSSITSNVVIAECESNDIDRLSENSVRLIEKLEHSTEDIENKFEDYENCQNLEFAYGNGNSGCSNLVEDSYFENSKEMHVTETADVSAALHDYNTDTNDLDIYLDDEIGSGESLENNRKEFGNSKTLIKREFEIKPKCSILYKSIETEDEDNIERCAISSRGEVETNSEEKLLHQDTFSSNVIIAQNENINLEGVSSNFIDCSITIDGKETQKDAKEKREEENSKEKADTNFEINSIFGSPKNLEVSLPEQ